MEKAFGTELHRYEGSGHVCRGRTGALHVPASLADRITAVLGLDTRPIATPKIVPHRGPTPPAGFLPTDVAKLYGFEGVDASGQCIGIIELGGGYTDADNQAAFKAMALAVPDDRRRRRRRRDQRSDRHQRRQRRGRARHPGRRRRRAAAPRSPSTSRPTPTRASSTRSARPCTTRPTSPSVLSISWGSAESGWTAQAIAAMGQAFQDAAQLGVTVCAASGDGLATDGVSDGKAHVDFPASSPLVLGCGGTKITASATEITDETVWNSNGGGTGGGVSAYSRCRAYQSDAGVPAAAGQERRTRRARRLRRCRSRQRLPDRHRRADRDHRRHQRGGAALGGHRRRLNASRKSPLGQIHAQLYGDPAALRDITSGNNKSGAIGFEAGKGWDACTGLGSPIGAALKALFRSAEA